MKLFDTRAFDDKKCVMNKTDPKCRWCVKSIDSCQCLLNVCHIKISDHWRNVRSHWGPKNLPIQSVAKFQRTSEMSANKGLSCRCL